MVGENSGGAIGKQSEMVGKQSEKYKCPRTLIIPLLFRQQVKTFARSVSVVLIERPAQ